MEKIEPLGRRWYAASSTKDRVESVVDKVNEILDVLNKWITANNEEHGDPK